MNRFSYLLWLGVATLVGVEILLQIGHGVVTQVHGRGTDDGQRATVLSVGDSYTFGIGASTPEGSYPSTLERLLRQRIGDHFRVSNAGWPGQNSHDVASRLQGQLTSASPTYVTILVGANDLWDHPERFLPESPTEASSGFEWELRTLRLFRILTGNRSSPTAEPSLQGPTPQKDTVAAGRELLQSSDYLGALEHVNRERERYPEAHNELRRIELVALVRLGRREEALAIAEEFATRFEEDPSQEHARFLLGALENTGQRERSHAFALELTGRYPDVLLAWSIVAWQAYELGDLEAAAAAFEESLRRNVDRDLGLRASTLRHLALAIVESDPERAAGLLVESVLLDQDIRRTIGTMRAKLGSDAEAWTRSYLEARELNVQENRLAEDLLRGLSEEHSDLATDHNLRQIVEMTIASGATPILLNYPFCPQATGEIQARVARIEGALWVDVCSVFQRELETRDREELFVADGHCTDDGYSLVAEAVAAAILDAG